MAHTKAKGSTKLGRDSESKRLGIKKNQDQPVTPGQIIVRQRGTKYYPGVNVRKGGDDTIYAMKAGRVKFFDKSRTSFNGLRKKVKVVSVIEV